MPKVRAFFPSRLALSCLVFLALLGSEPAMVKPRIATLDWAAGGNIDGHRCYAAGHG